MYQRDISQSETKPYSIKHLSNHELIANI